MTHRVVAMGEQACLSVWFVFPPTFKSKSMLCLVADTPCSALLIGYYGTFVKGSLTQDCKYQTCFFTLQDWGGSDSIRKNK